MLAYKRTGFQQGKRHERPLHLVLSSRSHPWLEVDASPSNFGHLLD